MKTVISINKMHFYHFEMVTYEMCVWIIHFLIIIYVCVSVALGSECRFSIRHWERVRAIEWGLGKGVSIKMPGQSEYGD